MVLFFCFLIDIELSSQFVLSNFPRSRLGGHKGPLSLRTPITKYLSFFPMPIWGHDSMPKMDIKEKT
jgi:hypothetical protein